MKGEFKFSETRPVLKAFRCDKSRSMAFKNYNYKSFMKYDMV